MIYNNQICRSFQAHTIANKYYLQKASVQNILNDNSAEKNIPIPDLL